MQPHDVAPFLDEEGIWRQPKPLRAVGLDAEELEGALHGALAQPRLGGDTADASGLGSPSADRRLAWARRTTEGGKERERTHVISSVRSTANTSSSNRCGRPVGLKAPGKVAPKPEQD